VAGGRGKGEGEGEREGERGGGRGEGEEEVRLADELLNAEGMRTGSWAQTTLRTSSPHTAGTPNPTPTPPLPPQGVPPTVSATSANSGGSGASPLPMSPALGPRRAPESPGSTTKGWGLLHAHCRGQRAHRGCTQWGAQLGGRGAFLWEEGGGRFSFRGEGPPEPQALPHKDLPDPG